MSAVITAPTAGTFAAIKNIRYRVDDETTLT